MGQKVKQDIQSQNEEKNQNKNIPKILLLQQSKSSL